MLKIMAMNGGVFPLGGQPEKKAREAQYMKRDLQAKLKRLFPNAAGDPIRIDDVRKEYVCRIKLVDKTDRRNSFADGRPDRQYLNRK